MGSKILAGRYELLEKIGEGGMAVVYKARCRLLNRFVAIKILKPEYTKDVKFIESFRRESQAAASLSHPNIVNIYDVGKEGNIHYIVMELVEGKVLSDLVKEMGAIPWQQAVEIIKQIASALSLAHKNHIIHRDVKPDNILITKEGTAKITDFGIAKAVNTGTILGNTGMVMGSVHYFSPEQARGGYVDEKSDIYSLGISLYELVTGRVPFDAENPVAVALMHMNEEMTPPSQVNPSVPQGLENIILKATSKYQINRFKTGEEMYAALTALSDAGSAGTNVRAMGGTEAGKKAGMQGQGSGEAAGKEIGEQGMAGKKTKRKIKINKIKVAAILLALICAIPASQLILNALESVGAGKTVQVPTVAGMTVEEATAALNEKNLKCEVDGEVVSKEYKEGQIVSQDPAAEMTVKEGYTIKVYVSKGSSNTTAAKDNKIPGVENRTLSDAQYVLGNYGFKVGQPVKEEHSEYPKGIVIRQDPKEGTEAIPGTVVNLVVSLGKEVEPASMPDLVGKELDAAKTELEKSGLKLGSQKRDNSSAYPPNIVMWQQYVPGTKLETGTSVDIKISKGAQEEAGAGTTEPENGPKTVALDVDYGKANNEVFYITVVISDEDGVRTVINRSSRFRSELSEVLTLTGKGAGTIKVIFDNDVVMERSVDFNTGVLS